MDGRTDGQGETSIFNFIERGYNNMLLWTLEVLYTLLQKENQLGSTYVCWCPGIEWCQGISSHSDDYNVKFLIFFGTLR